MKLVIYFYFTILFNINLINNNKFNNNKKNKRIKSRKVLPNNILEENIKYDITKPIIHTKEEDVNLSNLGADFCKNKCKIGNEQKICNDGKSTNCSNCVLKMIPDTITLMRKNQLCNNLCYQIINSNECAYFPFRMKIKEKKYLSELKELSGFN